MAGALSPQRQRHSAPAGTVCMKIECCTMSIPKSAQSVIMSSSVTSAAKTRTPKRKRDTAENDGTTSQKKSKKSSATGNATLASADDVASNSKRRKSSGGENLSSGSVASAKKTSRTTRGNQRTSRQEIDEDQSIPAPAQVLDQRSAVIPANAARSGSSASQQSTSRRRESAGGARSAASTSAAKIRVAPPTISKESPQTRSSIVAESPLTDSAVVGQSHSRAPVKPSDTGDIIDGSTKRSESKKLVGNGREREFFFLGLAVVLLILLGSHHFLGSSNRSTDSTTTLPSVSQWSETNGSVQTLSRAGLSNFIDDAGILREEELAAEVAELDRQVGDLLSDVEELLEANISDAEKRLPESEFAFLNGEVAKVKDTVVALLEDFDAGEAHLEEIEVAMEKVASEESKLAEDSALIHDEVVTRESLDEMQEAISEQNAEIQSLLREVEGVESVVEELEVDEIVQTIDELTEEHNLIASANEVKELNNDFITEDGVAESTVSVSELLREAEILLDRSEGLADDLKDIPDVSIASTVSQLQSEVSTKALEMEDAANDVDGIEEDIKSQLDAAVKDANTAADDAQTRADAAVENILEQEVTSRVELELEERSHVADQVEADPQGQTKPVSAPGKKMMRHRTPHRHHLEEFHEEAPVSILTHDADNLDELLHAEILREHDYAAGPRGGRVLSYRLMAPVSISPEKESLVGGRTLTSKPLALASAVRRLESIQDYELKDEIVDSITDDEEEAVQAVLYRVAEGTDSLALPLRSMLQMPNVMTNTKDATGKFADERLLVSHLPPAFDKPYVFDGSAGRVTVIMHAPVNVRAVGLVHVSSLAEKKHPQYSCAPKDVRIIGWSREPTHVWRPASSRFDAGNFQFRYDGAEPAVMYPLPFESNPAAGGHVVEQEFPMPQSDVITGEEIPALQAVTVEVLSSQSSSASTNSEPLVPFTCIYRVQVLGTLA